MSCEQKILKAMHTEMIFLPVFEKAVYDNAKRAIHTLMGTDVNHVLPMIRPFMQVQAADPDMTLTRMQHPKDWAMVFFLPNQTSFLLTSRHELVYNFQLPRACRKYSETCRVTPCSIWNGTVLGVEAPRHNAWYATDVYLSCGTNMMDKPFPHRQEELQRLQKCFPDLQLSSSMPNASGTRLWNETQGANPAANRAV